MILTFFTKKKTSKFNIKINKSSLRSNSFFSYCLWRFVIFFNIFFMLLCLVLFFVLMLILLIFIVWLFLYFSNSILVLVSFPSFGSSIFKSLLPTFTLFEFWHYHNHVIQIQTCSVLHKLSDWQVSGFNSQLICSH